MPAQDKLHLSVKLNAGDRVDREGVVVAERDEGLGEFVVVEGVAGGVLEFYPGHALVLVVDEQLLLLPGGHRGHAQSLHVADFADVVDGGGVPAADAARDGLLLQVPEVDGAAIIRHPLVGLLEVHNLVAAVASGDVLLCGKLVAAFPEDHDAVGEECADAVVAGAVAHREDGQLLLHLAVDFGLELLLLA